MLDFVAHIHFFLELDKMQVELEKLVKLVEKHAHAKWIANSKTQITVFPMGMLIRKRFINANVFLFWWQAPSMYAPFPPSMCRSVVDY